MVGKFAGVKEMIRYFIYVTLAMIILFTSFLYGFDREMARRDYERGYEANYCIFQSNCDYYNDMEIKDDRVGYRV